MASALTAAFGLTPTTGEALKAFNAINDFGNVMVANAGTNTPGAPKAFITLLLFDKNFNFVDATFDQIAGSAVQSGTSTKAPHDLMQVNYTVKEPGYAYIYACAP